MLSVAKPVPTPSDGALSLWHRSPRPHGERGIEWVPFPGPCPGYLRCAPGGLGLPHHLHVPSWPAELADSDVEPRW